jgi:anti-anti-sigma regulatory factor
MKNLVKQFGETFVIRLDKNLDGIADTQSLEHTLNGLVSEGIFRIALDLSKLTHINSDVVVTTGY